MSCSIMVACLLAGCTVTTPEVWREKCRHTYTMEVPVPYEAAHNRIVAAMYEVGWGEEVLIRQHVDSVAGRGSTWAGYANMRDPIGFVIDTERLGGDRAKITVYPMSAWYARKSRKMIEEALNLTEK